jgi:phage terminase small subunit
MTKNMTPKKRKAVAALLACPDITTAALKVGVSRETMYRYLHDPEIQAALEAAAQESLAQVSRALLDLGNQAVTTLGAALNDTEHPIAARIRAADIVLTRILQLREMVDYDRRITELEKRINS